MSENPERFWMVHSLNGPARHRHPTLHGARQEAERLARNNPCDWFYVLETISATRRLDLQTVELRERPEDPGDEIRGRASGGDDG